MSARVLVVGANGIAGAEVVGGLRAAGHTVRVLASPGLGRRVPFASAVDVLEIGPEPDAVNTAVRGIDIVCDLGTQLATPVGLEDVASVSLDWSPAVLEAAALAKVRRFIYVSSVAVYRP